MSEQNPKQIAEFWRQARAGLVGAPETVPEAWAFGATPAHADGLLALVLDGTKTGTASSLWDYEALGDPLPVAVNTASFSTRRSNRAPSSRPRTCRLSRLTTSQKHTHDQRARAISASPPGVKFTSATGARTPRTPAASHPTCQWCASGFVWCIARRRPSVVSYWPGGRIMLSCATLATSSPERL